MRNLWICTGCEAFKPCYIMNDSYAAPCRPCGSRCSFKHIQNASNIKLTYDVVEHREVV